MKNLFLVLLGFLALGYAHGEASLQSFYGVLGFQNHISNQFLVGNRFKRSTDLMAALCVQECANNLKDRMDEETSLDMETVSNGLVNRQLFQDENLEEFCRIYNDGRECIEQCGDFPMKKLIHNAFKPIDYMCVVRYNEFQKYLPCLAEGAEIVADSCDSKCGGSGYAAQSLQRMQRITQLDQSVRLMDDMCSHIRCSLDCELELYAEVCESETPADLLRDFTRVAMKQSQRIMKQAGVDYLFPDKCKRLVRDLSREHKERKEAENAIQETNDDVQQVADEFYERAEPVKRKFPDDDPFLF